MRYYGFNSLQTGKRIQRHHASPTARLLHRVSIPFKRESGSKGLLRCERRNRSGAFQFPSNGKAYPKEYTNNQTGQVSLSFNSLQTGKRIQRPTTSTTGTPDDDVFQFPSNGKADPKQRCHAGRLRWGPVSIPFKRESGSKDVRAKASVNEVDEGFNSLQTGKHIQRDHKSLGLTRNLKVSIPFKRESVSKAIELLPLATGVGVVSIPFKRESVSKAYRKRSAYLKHQKSFNSLQTGKHIQSGTARWLRESLETLVSIPFKRESISKGRRLLHREASLYY